MIGQKNLQDKLETLTLDNFPHSLIMLGESGCGRHLFCRLIADKLQIDLTEIKESITQETLMRMQDNVMPTIYLIDNALLTDKQCNVILKTLEEPTNNIYFVILCENASQVLQTVWNRCESWFFHAYTTMELEEFFDSNGLDPTQKAAILNIASTPGDVLALSKYNIDEMIKFARKILLQARNSGISALINGVVNQIEFTKTESNKYPFDLFLKILKEEAWKIIREDKDKYWEYSYLLINGLWNDHFINNINKRYLLEKTLIDLNRG